MDQESLISCTTAGSSAASPTSPARPTSATSRRAFASRTSTGSTICASCARPTCAASSRPRGSGGRWSAARRGKRERDRLLLALFAFAGLRRSELLGLDWSDVDLERRLIRVRRAKGGRQRAVPIHPALEPLFVDYLRIRAGDSEPALFVGVQGKRLSPTIMVQTFLHYASTLR